MKYKFILFSPWLLKSPVKVGALNPKAFGANLGLVGVASSVVVCCPCRVRFKVVDSESFNCYSPFFRPGEFKGV